MDTITELDTIWRMLAATGFGAVVGLERGIRNHDAGLRTHALISLAACVFTVVSIQGFSGTADTSRVASQIVSGVGFLGAGAILQAKKTTLGLTTAASIWIVAALGMAAGTGMFIVGTTGAAIAVAVLAGLKPISKRIGDIGGNPND